jgi:hypothetical protein
MRSFIAMPSLLLWAFAAPRGTTLTYAAAVPSASAQEITSALTGVALPAGSRLDRGLLVRPAAKSALDASARSAGHQLSDKFEVYKLPKNAETDVASAMSARLTAQGWTLSGGASTADERWQWMEKSGRKYMVLILPKPSDPWVYFAEYRGVAAVAAAPSAPPVSPSAPRPAAPAGAPSPASAPAPAGGGNTLGPVPSAPGRKGFAFTTTNFSDGWTSVERPAFVEATRGAITAWLHHRTPITDAMRPPVTRVSDFFWNRDVRPRFDVLSEDRREAELMYEAVDYIEGEVRDRRSGQTGYLAMYVHKTPAGGSSIVVRAPDRAALRQQYPKPQDLEQLLGTNSFAVGSGDLPGYWLAGGSAYGQYYYTSSGNYAGMAGTALSDEFWFASDGTYRSLHKGVTTSVGGGYSGGQSEYRGRWSLNGNWELTLTNRFRAASEVFLARLEAVQGGRILHLTRKDAPGIRYALVLGP